MDVSVCMITFNHANYIEQAIQSVLNQETSYQFEIIIGDDASTDQTADIIEAISNQHPGRIHFIQRMTNIGVQRNFADVIQSAQGRYILFLEGDDYWTSPLKIETQTRLMETEPAVSLCFHRTRGIHAETRETAFLLPPSNPGAFPSQDLLLGETNPIHLSSAMIRAISLRAFPEWFYNLKLADWPLFIWTSQNGRIAYLDQEMSHYRVHGNGYWSRLSPLIRLTYSVQMLYHIIPTLPAPAQDILAVRLKNLSHWWAKSIWNSSDPDGDIKSAFGALSDMQVETYLRESIKTHQQRLGFLKWLRRFWRGPTRDSNKP